MPQAKISLAVACVVVLAACGNSSPTTSTGTAGPTGAAAPTGTTVVASAQPSTNAPAGDPCSVIAIPTLEQITGLSGLAVQNQLGKSTNGCHWGAGTAGVAYDMLPMVLPADQMIARMQEAASGSGDHVTFKKVDLGHGHDGVQLTVPGSGTIDLFLPPNRYAAIVVSLPASSDVGAITQHVAEAFSAVSDKLPAAPGR